jgi:hypothetical protein
MDTLSSLASLFSLALGPFAVLPVELLAVMFSSLYSVDAAVLPRVNVLWACFAPVEWMPLGADYAAALASCGHAKVLQWARANDCPWDEETCANAADGGHLDVLKWARADGCPWDQDTCLASVDGGHTNIFNWARANGCPWSKRRCSRAAEMAQLWRL